MRILFLSQLIPWPLDAGPKVRSYYVLRHLAGAGHEITLLAFSRESDTAESIDRVRQFCTAVYTVPMKRSRVRDAWHFGRRLLTGIPFLIARDSVAEMTSMAGKLVASGGVDAIHADQLWMAQYALSAVATVSGQRPHLVLDQHNAMFLIPQRLAEGAAGPIQRALLRREASLMRRYEADTCGRFNDVVWVTADDQEAVGLPEPPAGPRAYVIPICVDPQETPVIKRTARPHRVSFLGGLHWPPNAAGIVWFAREVWPSVRAACPDAVLTILGKSPPKELDGRGEGIEVTGYVDDPMPYLKETAVFIVPLHAGGGMRVKILDAWAWGLPVVSTTIGAEGIDCRHGENLLIADTATGFATAVQQVMTDRQLARSLANACRAAVGDCYDWRAVYSAWDAIYPI